jgi:3-phenylpropionate/cinnamic acid dioxygenase small subunit
MNNSATEIVNLLYRYAELMDGGELEATAELFRYAQLKGQGGLMNGAGMLEGWRQWVKIHPCGTPRTKHVITNPIINGAATST